MAKLLLRPERLCECKTLQKLEFKEVVKPPPWLKQRTFTGLTVLSPVYRLNSVFLKISNNTL